MFKKYVLSDQKPFSTLFFKEKAGLLKLMEDFQKKKGKFRIKGFPNKMGLLLDGPPGTGKTSLIKAMAEHTKRHIVNINLAMIETNQMLMDLMFDLNFPSVNEDRDVPLKLDFNDIIFVMEDVDAASDVVFSRVQQRKKKKEKKDKKKKKAGNRLCHN
jgi:chaperone BCS1